MAFATLRTAWISSEGNYAFSVNDGIALFVSAAAAFFLARKRVNATWTLTSQELVSSSGRTVHLPNGCRLLFATAGLGARTIERIRVVVEGQTRDVIEWPAEPEHWRIQLAERGFDVGSE